MMKLSLKQLFAWSLLASCALFFTVGCSEEDLNDTVDDINNLFALGWNESEENLDSIPSNITLNSGNGNLPPSVDLTKYLPPIGDQGQFGTCVAWACAYNLETALEAQDQNLSQGQLADASRQMSPADLWQAIAASEKNSGCGGTNFEPAMEVMQNRGVASLKTAPYSQINCESSPPTAWTSDAANNKIDNFRKVNHTNVNELKGYLADHRPLAIGARLGDNFMSWNSDDVISNHSSFDNVGQHAYHAMVMVGYDDNKGPNGAFRIVNSWSNNWGDAGLIWVDYNFFATDFGFAAFVATNKKGQVDPTDPVDPNITGGDLVPWNVFDDLDPNSTFNTDRYFRYNVYNIGNATVPASADWNMSYLFYNAYNAQDYGIILFDYYSDDYGQPGQNGPLDVGPGIADNWWNYIDLPSGEGVAEVIAGSPYFEWTYSMPNITGYYYLVAFADAYDVLAEGDESDNIYFLTNSNGDPLYIQNGVVYGFSGKNEPSEHFSGPTKPNRDTPAQVPPHLRSSQNRNAYTPAEIKQFIRTEKKSGHLDAKMKEWLKSPNARKAKKILRPTDK